TGITRNLAHHAIRGQRRMVSLETAAGEAAPEPGPVQEAISREEEAIVWGALEGLDESYREPLVLFYREGQSVAAVAEALGISGDAVKQRLSRGREQVREKVAQRVEAALRRTRPGTAFTLAVLAALPAVVAGTATTAK